MFAITPRLALRPGWPEDAPALAHAIGHEEVVTKLSRAPWPYRESDAAGFLATAWQDDGPRFVITERAHQDRPIGVIGVNFDGQVPELGYWLTPAMWGRGYATEAGRAVVSLARDGLRLSRLTSGWFVGNPVSGRVLGKLGFRPTGRTLRQPSLALGREVEVVEMMLDLATEEAGPVSMAA